MKYWSLLLTLGVLAASAGAQPVQTNNALSTDLALAEGLAELVSQGRLFFVGDQGTTITSLIIFVLIAAAYITNRDAKYEKKYHEYEHEHEHENEHGSSYVSYRSLAGESTWLDSRDALFVLAFLLGEEGRGYECLNRVACQDEERAQDLLTVAKMFIKGSKILKPIFGYSAGELERATVGIQDAIEFRRGGGSCDAVYTCKAMPSL